MEKNFELVLDLGLRLGLLTKFLSKKNHFPAEISSGLGG